MEIVNIETICRLCLSEEGVMSNIFENQRNISDSSLVNCILYLFEKFELSIDDNLPKLICHKCNYLVEQSYKFHKQVEKTYSFLCDHISSTSNITEVEIEVVEEPEVEEEIQEDWILESEIEEEPVQIEEPTRYEDYEFLDNDETVIKDCPICLERCGNSFIKHLREHNQHQEWGSFFKESDFFQKYVCNICDEPKSIKRRCEFLIHIRRHLQIRPYKCTNCDSSFYSSNLLQTHVSKSHSNMNCETCFEIFTDKSEYIDHIKNVHKQNRQKSFSCQFCDKLFISMTNLKAHERTHSEVGRFKCTICDKFYHRKTDLTRHLTVHSGKKPFKCTLCESSFVTRPELNRHMIYHTSIRSFQCSFCDKSFFESGHLAFHQKSVHFKIKDFPCEFCDKDFTTSHKLKRHQTAKSCKGNKQPEEEETEINFIESDQNLPMQILNDEFDGICMEIGSGIDDNLTLAASNYEIVNIANGPVMDGKKINVIGLRNVNDEIQNYLLVEESLEDESNPFVFNGNGNI